MEPEPGQLELSLQGVRELNLSPRRSSRSLSCSSSSSSFPRNFRNLEHILLAAQQQQLRQLRRLQQLKKQAEIVAAQEATLAAKERAEQERKARRQAELAEEAARRAAYAELAEQKRKKVQEDAERHQDEIRSKLEAKLARMKPRYDAAVLEHGRRASAQRSAARMHRTLQRKEEVLEERRAAIMAAEAASERRLQQKQEDAIKREEEYLAEERRREIQARAEADEAAKSAYYQAKQEQREQRLQQHQEETEMLRIMRAQEANARFEYIRSRAAEVSAKDMARREELAQRVQEKLQRAEGLAEERAALTAHLRNTLMSNDLKFKQAMENAKARGSLELPAELMEIMTHLEEVMSSPYISPRSTEGSPCTGRYSSTSRPASLATSPRRQSLSANLGRISSSAASQRASSGGPAASQQRQQEAALQRVLEEEILREMDREKALQQAGSPEERQQLIQQFNAEREAAKLRILQIGNQLVPLEAAGGAAAGQGDQ